MPAEGPSFRRWFLRYKVEVAFLGLLAAAAIGGAFYIRHAEYVGGMNRLGAKGEAAFMEIFGVLVLASLGFIIWTIIQLFHSPRTGKHALLQVAFLIVPPIILVGGFMITVPLSPPFLRGFEQGVLREVDTDAIQQWVATEGHKYTFMKCRPEEVFPDELPGFLVPFKRTVIWFPAPASEGGLRVEFLMGGLHSWELVVGLPGMPMPKETGFSRHIKPGVYIVDYRL